MTLGIIIVSVLTILTNSWHVIDAWVTNPPNALFTGIAHYYADYFLYVSQMAQGSRGSWIWASPQFTNESLPPTWIYWFNVSLGHLGSIFHLSPFATYNISLIVLATLVLWVWYRIIRQIFPKQPLLQFSALLFVATASNFPSLIQFFKNGTATLIADFWFSPTPALNRLGGVPHQLWQTVLILSVIILFAELIDAYHSKARRTHRPPPANIWTNPFVYGLALVSFLAATANPIQMAIAGSALLGVSALWAYFERKLLKEHVLVVLFLTIPALIGAVVTNNEFAKQPILTAAKLWEINQPFALSLLTFCLALGPIIFFLPFGIRVFFQKLTPLKLALTLYGGLAVAIFFSPLPKLLTTSPIRWLSPAAYGIWPIIAAPGLLEVANMLTHIILRIMNTESGIMKKTLQSFFVTVFIILYSVFTIPSLLAQVSARSEPLATDTTLKALNHVAPQVTEGLTVLRSTSGNGVVLTDPALPYDVLVPVLTGKTSFTGHPIHTLYVAQKETLRNTFFSGRMTPTEASQFLSDHRIAFIITATQHETFLATYRFLAKQFSNATLAIYVVQL